MNRYVDIHAETILDLARMFGYNSLTETKTGGLRKNLPSEKENGNAKRTQTDGRGSGSP